MTFFNKKLYNAIDIKTGEIALAIVQLKCIIIITDEIVGTLHVFSHDDVSDYYEIDYSKELYLTNKKPKRQVKKLKN